MAGHDSAGGKDPFRAHATVPFHTAEKAQSAPRMHVNFAATPEASHRVADAAAAGQVDASSTAKEGDAEHPTHDQSDANYSQPRFVATEERRAAVRSQLAGLRRKARVHSQ